MDGIDAVEFEKMALDLYRQPHIERTLERIVEYAQEAASCDGAGVMLLKARGRVETVVASDAKVAEADRLQAHCGEGPCLQAIWDKDIFIVDDIATDARWPVWGPQAAELGYRSLLAVRLFTASQTLGALNLYGNRRESFDDDDVDVADVFGRHASIALASASEAHGLRQAVGARHVIGQAQGILMERYGLDADRAFALMRRYSQHHNVKLRDLARLVIEMRKLPDGPA
jgi:GAF domain-containing protein